MKQVLIISPYFPPSNTADMQRIRMSLPYFKANGWEPEIVMVHEQYSETVKDHLLLASIPADVKIHKVGALSKKWTSKFGLGSLALRSFLFYKRYVNRLLQKKHYDLIYFSTTEFMITILGSYWKKKFGVKYVIDMQDPWHSDYYLDKSKAHRPKKYWFSYRLHKYAEPMAMKKVDGLISVSQNYIDNLKNRYPNIEQIPTATITFGAFIKDLEISAKLSPVVKAPFELDHTNINIVYVGRAGYDMQKAISLLFESFKSGLIYEYDKFSKLKFFFIGTSYAPQGKGIQTVSPLAEEYGIEKHVIEKTDRIGFYESLYFLQKADALVIPGSDDPKYTASKIYPYILTKKPLLAIFNEQSNATTIINNCNAGTVAPLNSKTIATTLIYNFLKLAALKKLSATPTDWSAFEQYSAAAMTKNQCKLFDKVIN